MSHSKIKERLENLNKFVASEYGNYLYAAFIIKDQQS